MSWGTARPGSMFNQSRQLFEYGHARMTYGAPPHRLPPQPNQFERFESYEEQVEEEDDDDDEELIPLPEDLIRKFGKLTCELCLCTLPTVRQANTHYEGKKHEKRVMRYLEEWSSETNKKIPNCWVKLVCKRKQNTKLVPGSSEKFCGVCNIVLTSSVVAEQHYAGRSHNSALKLYKSKKSTPDNQSAAKSMFMCDICNVVASCQENLVSHMKGSRHRKVLQSLKEAENLEMFGDQYGEEDVKQLEQEAEFNVIQSSSGSDQYECTYCSWRGPPNEFEAHKRGLTHIAAVEEESKANLELEDDDDNGTEYTDVADLFCKLCNIQLTSKKEVAKHVKSRDHVEEVNLRKKQVLLSMGDPENLLVEEEHKCDLCLMKFPSKSMYDAHLQWKGHVKKLANKLQAESKQKCELCQLVLPSESIYKAHLSTKRHLSNVRWLNKQVNIADKNSKKSIDDENNVSDDAKKNGEEKTGSDEKPVESIDRTKVEDVEDGKNLEKLSKTENSVKESLQSLAKSKNENPDQNADVGNINFKDKSPEDKLTPTEDKVPNESAVFECEVCEISVSGKLPYEQHLISARHILQCGLKQATGSDDRKEPNAPGSAKHSNVSVKAVKPLFCKLCHVTSLTKYQHELHMNSKKHKDSVTKLEVLKYEPKLRTPFSIKPAAVSQNTFVAERKPTSHVGESFEKQGNSKNFVKTASSEVCYSELQPRKPFFMQSNSELANVPPHNTVSQQLRQPDPVAQIPQLFGSSPNVPPAATLRQHFPASSVSNAQYYAPPPPVQGNPVIQKSQDVGCVKAGSYTNENFTNPPPIRRSTYSCKDCGASFISGVDYKDHVNLCRNKTISEERKDLPVKSVPPVSQNDLYNCEACDVRYTTYRAFAGHRASAEHEANIEHLRQFGKRLQPVRKEKSKSEREEQLLSSPDHKEKGVHSRRSYECRRCDVSFFSQQAFNRHFNSTDHLRKPATYKGEIVSNRGEASRSSPSLDRGAKYERERRSSHEWQSGSRDQRRKTDSYDIYSKNLKRAGNSSSSEYDSDGMDLLPRKKIRAQNECNLCDKRYSSEREYQDHLKSKMHKSRMYLYECSDCSAAFSSKHELSNHMCSLGSGIRSVEGGDSGRWLQNWSSQDRVEQSRAERQRSAKPKHYNRYEADDDLFLEMDEDFEISRNLLQPQKQSEESLLSTFSFKREAHEIMSSSSGMPGFNY